MKVLTEKLIMEDNVKYKSNLVFNFVVKKFVLNSNSSEHHKLILSEKMIHLALLYLYRKAAGEVKHFVKRKVWEKIAYEVDGILLSKGRVLDGLNFQETGDFGDLNLGSLGIKVNPPVLDKNSLVSFSIAQHI